MTDIWFGTSGRRDAKILIVGEAWGEEEAIQQAPFVGQAGRLLHEMLREAGIDSADCLLANLMNDRPPNNDFSHYFLSGRGNVNGLNPTQALMTSLINLDKLIAALHPKLIIACGNYPLWALTGVTSVQKGVEKPKDGRSPSPDRPTGIGNYHGSQLYHHFFNVPVLPIYHPAAILRDWPTRRLTVHDLRMRVPLALKGEWAAPSWQLQAPPSLNEILLVLDTWRIRGNVEKVVISLDVETKWNKILTCIGLSTNATWAMSIPFVAIANTVSGLKSFWKPDEEAKILKALSALFKSPGVSILGQNLVYDCQWLFHVLKMKPRVHFDTLIAQNLLFPGTEKDLGSLSAMYCSHHRYWKDDNHEWSDSGSLEQHLKYNCEDVIRTLEIASQQVELIHHLGFAHLLPFEMEKFELAREMNETGIRRSPVALAEAAGILTSQMSAIGTRLAKLVPQEWIPTKSNVPWYRSDSQIKWVLYTLIGLKEHLDDKTKRPSSSKETLLALQDEYPRLRSMFQSLADYASLDTIYTTFIQAKTESDGKIHCSFNPAGTSTYRWSSSKNAFGRAGNMQNIPAGGDEDLEDLSSKVKKPAIRKIFTPDHEFLLVDADLRGADAQIVAWEADDQQMKFDLRAGIKLHHKTAAAFYGARWQNAKGDTGNKMTEKGKLYDDIKRVTHGTNYGASPRTIASKLGWTFGEAQRFRHWWLNVQHPGIGDWHRRTELTLRTTRTADNRFGYRILYTDRIDGLLPEALAWQPQSTVAIVSFKGAVALRKALKSVKFLLQVHDSIVFQIPLKEKSLLDDVPALLRVTVPYPDPLVVDSKLQISVSSWGEMEEWEKS